MLSSVGRMLGLFLRYLLAIAVLTFIPAVVAALIVSVQNDPERLTWGLILAWWLVFGVIAYLATKRRYERWRDRTLASGGPRAERQTEALAAPYFQTVDTSPEEERDLAIEHPEAWAVGVQKAEEVCRGKAISGLADDQLRYLADVSLVYEPGTPEATAFVTAFVRKAQEMVRRGEAG
jgi:hypothetical protein